jgi:hypothetical protein
VLGIGYLFQANPSINHRRRRPRRYRFFEGLG